MAVEGQESSSLESEEAKLQGTMSNDFDDD
jgi:hypothetical protein